MDINRVSYVKGIDLKSNIKTPPTDKMPVDSFVESSGKDRVFKQASLSDVFFGKGEEILREASNTDISFMTDMTTGEKTAVYRIGFDCKEDESILNINPSKDGTFSLFKTRKLITIDRELNEYFIVKTDERGLPLKETSVMKTEIGTDTGSKMEPFFRFAEDGRFIAVSDGKCQYFSAEGKEIWSKNISMESFPINSTFSPDGSAYIAIGNGEGKGILNLIGPDGSIRWKKDIADSCCELKTDKNGNLYLNLWERSCKVIRPNGSEGEPISISEGRRIGSVKVNDNGAVSIIAKEDKEPYSRRDLIILGPGKRHFIKYGNLDQNFHDWVEGKDGSIYIVSKTQYYSKIHAVGPDNKTKWEVDLPETFLHSKHKLAVGKDGNIYATINGIQSNASTPDSYKELFPPGKRRDIDIGLRNDDGSSADVKSLILCLSPDGKLLRQHLNKESYWNEESSPTALPNGDIVFFDKNDDAFIVSKNVEKYELLFRERKSKIISNKIREVEEDKGSLTIEKDEEKGIVNIGGVKLPIKKSMLEYDK